MNSAKKTNITALLILIILFFLIWAVREIVVPNYIPRTNYIFEAIIKLAVWVLFPISYLAIIDKTNWIKFLKIKPPSKKLLLVSIIIALAWFAIEAFSNTKFYGYHFHFNKNIGDWINTFLIVGFTEEILFRGFILNKLKEYTSFGKANLIQAVLFVLIHVPVWVSLNKEYFVIGSIWEYLWAVGFVFLFGIAMGYTVKKTNSLWPAILIHSFGDLAYVLTII